MALALRVGGVAAERAAVSFEVCVVVVAKVCSAAVAAVWLYLAEPARPSSTDGRASFTCKNRFPTTPCPDTRCAEPFSVRRGSTAPLGDLAGRFPSRTIMP
jgi:hypothetical protein